LTIDEANDLVARAIIGIKAEAGLSGVETHTNEHAVIDTDEGTLEIVEE
jgi:hypothetical protein